MIKQIPNGVYPTMITPFTADNKVDYNAVEQLIEWYDKRGVDGIFAICQSSEIFFLTFEERLELLKFVVKNTPKHISIVASGHTEDDIETQIFQARKFIEVGIDGYVFISNRLAKQDEDDSVYLRNTEYFVSQIDEIGLGVYECPYPYKRLLTPNVLSSLAATGRFMFLKDTCCKPEMIRQKLEAVKGTQLKIFNANCATILETLRMGCAGFSGVMANFHPEIYSWLCKNFETMPEKAETVQAFLAAASMAECQMYPVNAKYYLGLDGINMGYVTRSRDYKAFSLSNKREIEGLYKVTELFKKEMGIEI